MRSRFLPRFPFLLLLLVASRSPAAQPAAELSKGHRLFVERGLHLHALCFHDHPLSAQTLKDAGFTGITWAHTSDFTHLGPPPSPLPWCRWIDESVTSPAALPPAERPYADQIAALQLSDEQDLNNPAIRAAAKKWFETARKNFPNALLYTNQYGGQLTNEALQAYITGCRPDMLSFDTYPWLLGENNTRGFFGDCMRYRKFALAHDLPASMWIQTFHGENRYRDPAEAELRLNVFAAWTYGFQMTSIFTYNAGSSSLFKGPGDRNPTPAFAWLAKLNRESRNLSSALVRLKSTDVRVIAGQHTADGKPTPNPLPWDNERWSFDKTFPLLRGVTVTNLGSTNDRLPGDVFLGFFQPLHPSLTARGGEHDTYLMVTNALTSRTAPAAACRQRITLNLVFPDGITPAILRLSQSTGKPESLPLAEVPNDPNRRLLHIDLDGGSGELIKLSPGGSGFIGVTPTP